MDALSRNYRDEEKKIYHSYEYNCCYVDRIIFFSKENHISNILCSLLLFLFLFFIYYSYFPFLFQFSYFWRSDILQINLTTDWSRHPSDEAISRISVVVFFVTSRGITFSLSNALVLQQSQLFALTAVPSARCVLLFTSRDVPAWLHSVHS